MSGRILVCGSRTYSDQSTIWRVLDGLFENQGVGYLVVDMDPLTIIEGGAKGADRIACQWVLSSPLHGPVLVARPDPASAPDECYVMHEQYPAAWDEHDDSWCPGEWCRAKSFCKGAGPRRNQQMLEAKPDEVWAFIDKPLIASAGTHDMVIRATRAGVPVRVVQTM